MAMTDNDKAKQALLADPFYAWLKQQKVDGIEDVVDSFEVIDGVIELRRGYSQGDKQKPCAIIKWRVVQRPGVGDFIVVDTWTWGVGSKTVSFPRTLGGMESAHKLARDYVWKPLAIA